MVSPTLITKAGSSAAASRHTCSINARLGFAGPVAQDREAERVRRGGGRQSAARATASAAAKTRNRRCPAILLPR